MFARSVSWEIDVWSHKLQQLVEKPGSRAKKLVEMSREELLDINVCAADGE